MGTACTVTFNCILTSQQVIPLLVQRRCYYTCDQIAGPSGAVTSAGGKNDCYITRCINNKWVSARNPNVPIAVMQTRTVRAWNACPIPFPYTNIWY